ncbi:MAG: BtpA/SgcQ family protein [Verrucomicrobiales bacterium]|nr:BtpA/SgcQ family protein [Verrucomicrobiales bacterium]
MAEGEAGPVLVGVVHLLALPGSPRWGGSPDAVCAAAAADAVAYAAGGAGAVIVENFGDVPFTRGRVEAETVAGMALAAAAVRGACGLPVGFNVLRNDVRSALGLAAACGGEMVRVNVHCGSAATDQGVIEGEAFATMRVRAGLCPGVEVWADVHVKHATPLGDEGIGAAAEETLGRGLADAVVVSGSGTGKATARGDLEAVRGACPGARIYVGSGATVENAGELLRCADGLIVGSSLKRDGVLSNPVDVERVKRLAEVVRG